MCESENRQVKLVWAGRVLSSLVLTHLRKPVRASW